MPKPETIQSGHAYHAGTQSHYTAAEKAYEAERLEMIRGNDQEAQRHRRRAREHEGRARKQERAAKAKVDADKPRQRYRDPLDRFPHALKQAGLALRDHAEGETITMGTSAGDIKEFVDGGYVGTMEALVDRRRIGRAAWREAEQTCTNMQVWAEVRQIIVSRRSFAMAAQRAYGVASGPSRTRIKGQVESALDAAAAYLGIVGNTETA